jgi:tetratricopeptide (TPR) repeat protein
MFKQILCVIFFVFTLFKCAAAEYKIIQAPCECYTTSNPYYYKVNSCYHKYKEIINRNFMKTVFRSYDRARDWETPFFERWDLPTYSPIPITFSDYHKNFLIRDAIVDLIKDHDTRCYLLKIKEEPRNKDWYLTQLSRLDQRFNICKNAFSACYPNHVSLFEKLHRECLTKHKCLETYYDYGMLNFLNENHLDALAMIKETIQLAKESGREDILSCDEFRQLGIASIEMMAYEEAIEFLSKAIERLLCIR